MKFFSTLISTILISTWASAQLPQVTSARYLEPISGIISSVDFLSISQSNNEITQLRLNLPEDLVGPKSTPLTFNTTDLSTPFSWQMASADGTTMNCLRSSESTQNVQCTFQYPGQYSQTGPIDNLTDVQDFLKTKYSASPNLLQEKLQTAAIFHGDPEGVLSFIAPGPTQNY